MWISGCECGHLCVKTPVHLQVYMCVFELADGACTTLCKWGGPDEHTVSMCMLEGPAYACHFLYVYVCMCMYMSVYMCQGMHGSACMHKYS